MAETTSDLPADLAEIRESYVDTFGTWPPLPAGRFAFSSSIDPEFLRICEKLRAHALYSQVFDHKTTQLILVGMLMVAGHPAAQIHAVAARRAGASWEELHKIVELATAMHTLMPANQGFAMLNALREKETGGGG